jgi:hypothetical protein
VSRLSQSAAPGFDRLVQFAAFLGPVVERQPFDRIADDHRGQADCRFLATTSRSWLASTTQPSEARGGREKVSDGVPCSQMPLPVAPLALVPFVRVIERIGAAAVEVGQFLAGQVGGDVIDTDRRLLVAFGDLVGAQFALRHVIVGDKARTATMAVGRFRRGRGVTVWCRRRWRSAGRAASAAGSAARNRPAGFSR